MEAPDGRSAVEVAETAVDDDENLLAHIGHVGARHAELGKHAPHERAASLEDLVEIESKRHRGLFAFVDGFRGADLHASHWRRFAGFLDQNEYPTPNDPPPATADIRKTSTGGSLTVA
jgi:hypothetical protein